MATKIIDESREGSSVAVQRLETLRNSPLLLGVLFGIGLIGSGLLLGDGAVAGMLGIYGATIVLVSTVSYAVLTVVRRNH